MGAGFSSSSNTSVQTSNANLSQVYSGSCDINCSNTMDDVNITFINSNVGGDVDLTQTCSVNGQCLMDASQGSYAQTQFKAGNSAAASSAGGWLSGLFNIDITNNTSYQQMNQNIMNSINEECKVTSLNEMNNINVFAENSNIGGSVVISQSGTSNGDCSLQAEMTASALASGSVNNCSQSGKKAKKSCSGKGSSIGDYIIYFFIGVFVLMVATALGKAFSNKQLPTMADVKTMINTK